MTILERLCYSTNTGMNKFYDNAINIAKWVDIIKLLIKYGANVNQFCLKLCKDNKMDSVAEIINIHLNGTV